MSRRTQGLLALLLQLMLGNRLRVVACIDPLDKLLIPAGKENGERG